MLENFAWGQEFSWGRSKHPPLIAWIAHGWFSIFPNTDAWYHLLAYLIAALGLLGVYRFALAYGLRKLALPATLLLSLALPYSTLAVKFNANTVLLLTWPWVAWAWVKAIRSPGYGHALLLGGLAAIAMLGKYYSAVFLLALGLATLVTPAGRSWLLSRYMLTALVTALIVLTPHLVWQYKHDFPSFNYIQEKHQERGDPVVSWIKFAFLPVIYWLIPWLLSTWIFSEGVNKKEKLKHWGQNLLLVWKPTAGNRELFLIALGPYLISLVLGGVGFVVLSSPWAMPLGFAFTMLWLANLDEKLGTDQPKLLKNTTRGFTIWLGLILFLSPVYAWQQATSGAHNYYKPRADAARALIAEWQNQVPNHQFQWVAGSNWPETGLVSFYGDQSIYALEGLPNEFPATLVPLADWDKKAGMLLCLRGYLDQPELQGCSILAEEWLKRHHREVRYFELTLAREGRRFPVHRPYRYRAYIVLPQ